MNLSSWLLRIKVGPEIDGFWESTQPRRHPGTAPGLLRAQETALCPDHVLSLSFFSFPFVFTFPA